MANQKTTSRFREPRRRVGARVCPGAATLAAALFLAAPALAQYGQIEGTVVDATGAVLPAPP